MAAALHSMQQQQLRRLHRWTTERTTEAMSIEPQQGTGWCAICQEPVPTQDLLGHLRVMHPEQYGDGPERWPDGRPVVVDTTLTPDDFGEGL
jgi:hypothetical protein